MINLSRLYILLTRAASDKKKLFNFNSQNYAKMLIRVRDKSERSSERASGNKLSRINDYIYIHRDLCSRMNNLICAFHLLYIIHCN